MIEKTDEVRRTIYFNPIQSLIYVSLVLFTVFLLTTQYYLYALLPGLIILFLFILGHSPKLGYYLIVFFIPFGAYRGLSETYPFLRIHWLLALWLLILVTFQFIFQKKDFVKLRSNLWLWFLIFLVLNLVSALMSGYPSTSFESVFLLIVAYLFIALTMIFISTSRDFIRILPIILVISIAISSFLSVIGYVFNLSLFAEKIEGFKRGTGGTFDPNNLSLMIIFSLPFLSHWFFISRKVLEKSLAILLIALNIVAIFFTYSRGGIIVLVITLIFIIIENLQRLRPKYFGFILLLAVISITMVSIFISPSYVRHLKRVTSPAEEKSIGLRTAQLDVGWEAFKKHPILGSGPGTYREFYAHSKYAYEFAPKIESIYFLRHKAHNVYLEILVGTGSLGLIIFIIILYIAIRNFTFAKKTFNLYGKKEIASLVGAYRLSFISLLIYLFIFSDVYHKYLLLSLALSQVALKLSQEQEEREPHRNTDRN